MTAPRFARRPKVYSVAELTAGVRDALGDRFADVRVAGEISNARRYPSGHWYFTLKDERAQLACVCFRRDAAYLKAQPADGVAVVARGRIDVYERKGNYQLIVESMEPQGVGALQREFERLKRKLDAEGLFDEARKRPLPGMPRRIGLVTSSSGAVIADMLRILERRFPGLAIRLYPVRVQGQGAAEEIAAGIRYFSAHPWADVVIAGRGGGSIEDLWAFNEEVVARAIAASGPPLVSAVGHQTDFTIADFVADQRAATPSAAAEIAVPDVRSVLQRVGHCESQSARAMRLRLTHLSSRLERNSMERAGRQVARRINETGQALDDAYERLRRPLQDRLRLAGERLARIDNQLVSLDLRVRLARQSRDLGRLASRLDPAMHQILLTRTARLAALSARLDALSPLAILERGYAIVRTREGVAVRDAAQVAAGDALGVRLHRGRLAVTVQNAEPEPPTRSSGEESV